MIEETNLHFDYKLSFK